MPLVKFCIAMTLLALGCVASPERVVAIEQSVTRSEQGLGRADESYDLSEQDIARLRVVVDEIVERGRLATQHLEMAAHDFQRAAMYNYLASNEFIRAAASYEQAAETYRQVASLIIQLASSGRFLNTLCKRPTSVDSYRSFIGAFGVKLDEKRVEQLIPRLLGEQGFGPTTQAEKRLDLPLSAMNSLAKRATRLLLCSK